MQLELHRQHDPDGYRILAPARRFEEPFLDRFHRRHIEIAKSRRLLDEHLAHPAVFQYPNAQRRNALHSRAARRLGISRLDRDRSSGLISQNQASRPSVRILCARFSDYLVKVNRAAPAGGTTSRTSRSAYSTS